MLAITLGKLIGLLFLFCLHLLSILFLKTKRNDLARPVMGTIFLVIMVRATSVYSAGEPYAATLYCRGKNPATLGYVSVLEFVAIESYLKKAISSDYPTKSIELQKKRLGSAAERARARASSACAQTRCLLCMIKVVQLKSMENVFN